MYCIFGSRTVTLRNGDIRVPCDSRKGPNIATAFPESGEESEPDRIDLEPGESQEQSVERNSKVNRARRPDRGNEALRQLLETAMNVAVSAEGSPHRTVPNVGQLSLNVPEVARRSQFAFGHSCECYPFSW